MFYSITINQRNTESWRCLFSYCRVLRLKSYTPLVCGVFVKNFSIACFVSSRRRCWKSLTHVVTVETISRAASCLVFIFTSIGISAIFISLFLITFILAFAVIIPTFLICMNPILFKCYKSSFYSSFFYCAIWMPRFRRLRKLFLQSAKNYIFICALLILLNAFSTLFVPFFFALSW